MASKTNRPKLATLGPRLQALDPNVRELPTGPAKWASPGRLSSEERGYGHQWRRLRLQILERDGWRCRCATCVSSGRITTATEVHHVVGKAEWGRIHGTLDGVDDPSNLLSLNRTCHAEITARDAAKFR